MSGEMSEHLLENIILDDEFSYKSDLDRLFRVCLCEKHLEVFDNGDAQNGKIIHLSDIIGSKVEESYTADDPSAFLIVDICQRLKSGKNMRKQFSIRLASSGKSKQQNFSLVKKWHLHLSKCSDNLDYYENKTKPFLIFVNPNSGSGKANVIFLKHTVNIWNQADAPFEPVITGKMA